MNMFSRILKILFTSKDFKMQNESFNEHYYKIKKVPLSQYYSMLEENLSSGFPAISDIIKPGCMTTEDGFRLDFSVVRKKRDLLSM